MSAPGTAGNGDEVLEALIPRIAAKRRSVDGYLRDTRRRSRRLVQISIIAGSVAATLTAAPALGGEPLSEWLTQAVSTPAPAWRFLCAFAALCSLSATVATQFLKSNNYEERIAKAQGARTTLEILEVEIESGRLEQEQAAERFAECIESTSFIHSAGGT